MLTGENKTKQTPLKDLRESDLELYDRGASAIHHYSSGIPKAINFYYDYKQLSNWRKFLLIFNQ